MTLWLAEQSPVAEPAPCRSPAEDAVLMTLWLAE